MRRILPAAVIVASSAGMAACGSTSSPTATGATPSSSATAASCSNAGIQKDLYQKGALTVATDKPVYPPWFENNNPASGTGYESAVSYAIAKQLGFTPAYVHWAYEPFDASYAPGPKKFDFDINEISYTPQRATAVSFSSSYYDVQQALVALKGTPIVTHHTAADLKSYIFGDQVGTTSLAFITSQIQPASRPKVFQTLNDVKQALQTHQIAALVTDTPTAQYISSSEIPGSVMVAELRRALRAAVQPRQPAGQLCQPGHREAEERRHAARAAEEVLADLPHRADDHSLSWRGGRISVTHGRRPAGPTGRRLHRPRSDSGEPRRRVAGSWPVRHHWPRPAAAVRRRSPGERDLDGEHTGCTRRAGRGLPAGPGQRAGQAYVLQPARHVAVVHRQPQEGLLLG